MNPTQQQLSGMMGQLSQAQQMLNNIQPQVNAGQLSNPTTNVSVPQPSQPVPPSQFVNNLEPAIQSGSAGVQNLQNQIVTARTNEANQRNDVLNRLLDMEGLNSQGTFNSAFNSNLQSITGQDPDAFIQQLGDANTALATLQGKFRTAKQDISSGQGQSKIFEGVQLNEMSRQEAVEVGNQALLVQAMQGNFDTARQIALDTANFASQDKKVELDNLLAQYDALTGIVDQQTQQLLDQEKVKIQQEMMQIERTQNLVDNAIVAGMATVEEMQYLTSTEVSDVEKQRIAMQIINRGARSDRFAGSGTGGSGSVSLTSENASMDDLLQTAQFLSPKFTSKFQQDSFNAQVNAMAERGDRKGLQEFIISSAIDTLPNADMKRVMVNTKSIIDGINDIESLLQEYELLGGQTSLLVGTKQNVTEKLGAVGNPQLAEVGNRIVDLVDQLGKMRSGAALTKDEEKLYKQLFPSGNRSRELNSVKIKSLKDSLNTTVENTLASQLGSAGFTAVTSTNQTTQQPQTFTANGKTYQLGADGLYYEQ